MQTFQDWLQSVVPALKGQIQDPTRLVFKPRFLSLCSGRDQTRLWLSPPQKWDFVVSSTDVREVRAGNALILTLVVRIRKRKMKKDRPRNFSELS